MPTFMHKSEQIEPVEAVKLRERSADSMLYTLDGHKVDFPQTLTITNTLPSPRKGNPGTVKTVINLRLTDTLDKGLPTQRNVPIIIKVETSFPVGSDEGKRILASDCISAIMAQSPRDMGKLFYNGLLPDK